METRVHNKTRFLAEKAEFTGEKTEVGGDIPLGTSTSSEVFAAVKTVFTKRNGGLL